MRTYDSALGREDSEHEPLLRFVPNFWFTDMTWRLGEDGLYGYLLDAFSTLGVDEQLREFGDLEPATLDAIEEITDNAFVVATDSNNNLPLGNILRDDEEWMRWLFALKYGDDAETISTDALFNFFYLEAIAPGMPRSAFKEVSSVMVQHHALYSFLDTFHDTIDDEYTETYSASTDDEIEATNHAIKKDSRLRSQVVSRDVREYDGTPYPDLFAVLLLMNHPALDVLSMSSEKRRAVFKMALSLDSSDIESVLKFVEQGIDPDLAVAMLSSRS